MVKSIVKRRSVINFETVEVIDVASRGQDALGHVDRILVAFFPPDWIARRAKLWVFP